MQVMESKSKIFKQVLPTPWYSSSCGHARTRWLRGLTELLPVDSLIFVKATALFCLQESRPSPVWTQRLMEVRCLVSVLKSYPSHPKTKEWWNGKNNNIIQVEVHWYTSVCDHTCSSRRVDPLSIWWGTRMRLPVAWARGVIARI